MLRKNVENFLEDYISGLWSDKSHFRINAENINYFQLSCP